MIGLARHITDLGIVLVEANGLWKMNMFTELIMRKLFALNDSSANMVTAKFLFAPPNTSIF